MKIACILAWLLTISAISLCGMFICGCHQDDSTTCEPGTRREVYEHNSDKVSGYECCSKDGYWEGCTTLDLELQFDE